MFGLFSSTPMDKAEGIMSTLLSSMWMGVKMLALVAALLGPVMMAWGRFKNKTLFRQPGLIFVLDMCCVLWPFAVIAANILI